MQIMLSELQDDKQYVSTKAEVADIVFGGDKDHEVVFIDDTGEKVTQTAGRALASLVLLEPLRGTMITLDRSVLFMEEPLPSGVTAYFDHYIRLFKENCEQDAYDEFKLRMAEAVQDLCQYTSRYNRVLGNSATLLDVLDAMRESDEFETLVHFEIPPNLQFDEIERLIKSTVDRAVDILKARTGTPLANYLGCGSIINVKQFGQSVICVGLKPDLQGHVLSESVNTSFLRGMRSPTDYYISALGARKALVTNHKQVKTSGYLARKIALLTIDQKQDPELEDCGTQHGIAVDVTDAKVLGRLDGRWYYDDESEELKLLNSQDDSHLIGSEIFIRSPITCNGEKICQKCFGIAYKDNAGYNVGLVATLILTSQITQLLLSSKHLLQTNSNAIDWPEGFDSYFTVDKAIITATPRVKNIFIDREDIIEDEESDIPYTQRIGCKDDNGNRRTFEVPVKFFLSDEILSVLGSTNGDISYQPDKNESEFDFYMSLENNELNASLNNILNLIGRKNDYTQDNIDEVLNEFLQLLNESNIRIQSNHVETILRALIWAPDGSRPKFDDEEFPEFNLLKVSDSVMHGPLAVSLVFEHIKKQFTDPATFEKAAKSVLEGLY